MLIEAFKFTLFFFVFLSFDKDITFITISLSHAWLQIDFTYWFKVFLAPLLPVREPSKNSNLNLNSYIIDNPLENRKSIAEYAKNKKGVYIFEILNKNLYYVCG